VIPASPDEAGLPVEVEALADGHGFTGLIAVRDINTGLAELARHAILYTQATQEAHGEALGFGQSF
jgi:hypothetical protein